ncbi:hypothetical protein BH24GEM1_BH24GEM1_18760 [soil metagenome]
MIRNLMALPCMLALLLACGDGRMDDRSAGTAGSETGTLPADTGYTGGGFDDTTAAPSAPNQDQSGVTNTETGESELGGDVTRTSPDQGEPVTSKGDTVGTGGAGIADTTN